MRKPKRVDLQFAKHVLKELDSKGLLSRKALDDSFPGSRAQFDSTFIWLCAEGHVVKSSGEHRAPYSITEKGRRFLEGLS